MASLSSAASAASQGTLRAAEVRTMEYPRVAGDPDAASDPVRRVRELEAQLAERERLFRQQVESARLEAAEQGKQAAAGERAAWHRTCEAALTRALAEFCAAREEYLGRVEREVVRLALAVAERILQREAQMDPLLLAGVVRVALGRLSESTAVRLRVPSGDREMWAEMLRLMPGLPLRPEVLGDAALEAGDARLEADIGSVDLGVRAQMGEIERGFFDAPGGTPGRDEAGDAATSGTGRVELAVREAARPG
ncbi:MAG: FliH/SctL family protein [Acidobacteriaceae bacterium]